jgi:hypothetical protein
LVVRNTVRQNVLVILIALGTEMINAQVCLILIRTDILRQVLLVISHHPIAIQNLIGHELVLFRLLAFVDFCLFGHV